MVVPCANSQILSVLLNYYIEVKCLLLGNTVKHGNLTFYFNVIGVI